VTPSSLFVWTTVLAAALALAPLLWFSFCGQRLQAWTPRSRRFQLALPAALCLPYILATAPLGWFRWQWLLLYLLLPVCVAAALALAAQLDPGQRGHWLEYLVLLGLGLAVDLRWFEGAWPHRLAAFNKVLLLDAGLYGFLSVRRLTGVGLDLRLRRADWKIGLREWAFYTPIAIGLGLALGFLHLHRHVPHAWQTPFLWVFTFFLVALPEEIFFRGWMQNLLARRMGPTASLLVTSIVFGLAHFNKRTTSFNWRYVLMAAIAGIFYGRAWYEQRRVGASAITHATVDTLWGALLR
jgi:membrane protease YdiL (CAAX protease family)